MIEVGDLAIIAAVQFFASMFAWFLWGSLVTGRQLQKRTVPLVKKAVVEVLAEPDEDTEEALKSVFTVFWQTLNEATIEVEAIDGEGKPMKAKISPMQSILSAMIEQISGRILSRFHGSKGAAQRDVNRMESQFAAQMGFPPPPRKGQSPSEYFLERLGEKILPVIEEKINVALTNASQGGKKEGML